MLLSGRISLVLGTMIIGLKMPLLIPSIMSFGIVYISMKGIKLQFQMSMKGIKLQNRMSLKEIKLQIRINMKGINLRNRMVMRIDLRIVWT